VPIANRGSMARRRTRRTRGFELRLNGKAAHIAGVVFLIAALALTIGCVVYTATPAGVTDTPPERFRPEPLARLDRVECWIPYWTNEGRLAREATDAGFTDLLFFHGSVAADGSVKLEDEPGLAQGVRAAGTARTWLTVTNHGGSLQRALVDDPDSHLESLLLAFARSGCSHLDLDYESLNYAMADGLVGLCEKLAPRMPEGARLALTLQPVDSHLRPEQRGIYRRLLEAPHIYTVRLMMYDYHWKNSLPGALYPMPAFRRLVEEWAEHAHRLTLALPLYGYDWPRPEDVSIPRADVVTLRDLASLAGRPGFDAVWMHEEGELAVRYQDGGVRMVGAPSLRAVQARVQYMLDRGVPGVSFWHMGCADPAAVRAVCERDVEPRDAISYDDGSNWASWLDPWKLRVCRTIIADGTQSLDQLAAEHGVARSVMYRFNTHITGANPRGQTVYIPE
jgi:hypothetical protein